MTFTTTARRARRAATAALAAGLVALLTACPSEIDGRVDRIGGPISGGGTGGGTTGGGGGGGGGGTTAGEIHGSFTYVAVGAGVTCALNVEGKAYCWGYNKEGQLGVGNTTSQRTPTAVATTERFTFITTSGGQTCAATAAGAGWCWGSTYKGMTLTTSAAGYNHTPQKMNSSIVWKSFSFGWLHMCGLDVDGVAYCWGDGGNGQTGRGSYHEDDMTPVPVAGGLRWKSITAADLFSCGVTVDNQAYCWGSGRYTGYNALGGPLSDTNVPQSVTSSSTFLRVTGNAMHTCALEAEVARVSCWGQTGSGGSEGTGSVSVPTRVGLEQDVIDVSAGSGSSCLVSATNRVWCWGLNWYGQVGTGNDTPAPLPRELPTATGFSQVAVGPYHACGIGLDGNTYCWGVNPFGELGNGQSNSMTPTAPVRVL